MNFFSSSNVFWTNFHPIQILMYLLLIGLIVLSMFGGAKMRKGSGSGGGISRGRGGSITVIN